MASSGVVSAALRRIPRPSPLTVSLALAAGGVAYLAYDYVRCKSSRNALLAHAPVFKEVRRALEDAERTLASTPDPSQSEDAETARFDRELLEVMDPAPLLSHSERLTQSLLALDGIEATNAVLRARRKEFISSAQVVLNRIDELLSVMGIRKKRKTQKQLDRERRKKAQQRKRRQQRKREQGKQPQAAEGPVCGGGGGGDGAGVGAGGDSGDGGGEFDDHAGEEGDAGGDATTSSDEQ